MMARHSLPSTGKASCCQPTTSRAETVNYLQVIVPGTYPTGGVGTQFGDTRVEAAALLAVILHPYREQLGINSIGVHGDLRQNPVVQLEIAGTDNRRWFWGSPPGSEIQGEPTAKMKLQSLIDGAPSESDLRQVQYAPTPIVQSPTQIEAPRVTAANTGARDR